MAHAGAELELSRGLEGFLVETERLIERSGDLHVRAGAVGLNDALDPDGALNPGAHRFGGVLRFRDERARTGGVTPLPGRYTPPPVPPPIPAPRPEPVPGPMPRAGARPGAAAGARSLRGRRRGRPSIDNPLRRVFGRCQQLRRTASAARADSVRLSASSAARATAAFRPEPSACPCPAAPPCAAASSILFPPPPPPPPGPGSASQTMPCVDLIGQERAPSTAGA